MKNRLIAIFYVILLAFGAVMAYFPSVLGTAEAPCVLSPEAAPAPDTSKSKFSGAFFGTFDTVVTLVGYAPSREDFDRELQHVNDMFTADNQIFDNYNEYDGINNLYVLNRDAASAPVPVCDELFDLLSWCKKQQEQYGSDTVNIAMGSVLSIWHEFRERAEADPTQAAIPDMDILSQANQHVSIESLILNEKDKTVYYADPELKLDLGAVAKGYAAERAAQYLLSSSMPSFILSAGGNVRAGNIPSDGRINWTVGVQDPDGNNVLGQGDIMDTLSLHNASVVTSGDYQRYYMADGIRCHHLISPVTLMPADHFRGVTIVTESSELADYLSTRVFLMPYDEGRAFVDSLEGVEALWILPDRTVEMTDGMKRFAKSQSGN